MWSYLKRFFFKPEISLMDLPETSLMDLPDNVLENIFKYLDLKEQMELASMNEHFNTIIQNVWRHSDQECSLIIKDSPMSNEELCSILMQTSQYLKKIDIYEFNFEQWKIIKQYKYPNAKELSINFKEKNANNVISILNDLFPNLKSLRLSGQRNFHDRNIDDLIKLKSLEKLDAWKIDTFNSFQKILEELNLKYLSIPDVSGPFRWTSNTAFEKFCALERIRTFHSWTMLHPHILQFSNLKEIWGFAEMNGENIELKAIFREIIENKPQNIKKIILGKELSLTYLLSNTFINLKRLEILYQDMNDYTDVFKCAPNVREIVFFYCNNLQEKHVKQILKSTQIEFFYVLLCNCEFETITIDVNDIVKGRTKPLYFDFFGIYRRGEIRSPYDSHVECNINGKSPLFKEISSNYRYADFDHYSVEFQ